MVRQIIRRIDFVMFSTLNLFGLDGVTAHQHRTGYIVPKTDIKITCN